MKKYQRNVQAIFALVLCCVCIFTGVIQPETVQAAGRSDAENRAYTLQNLTATDALGRTLPEAEYAKDGKYVGVFYFLWHGQHGGDKTRDMTKLLKTNYNDIFGLSSNHEEVIPWGSWIHWNEPLYGYYSSSDEWVMRKHIELFIAADIDFVMMDFTNGVYYKQPLTKFMDLLLEYKEAGWDVPKITFYINLNAAGLTKTLYRSYYKKAKYKDLFFYGNSSKPLIVSVPDQLDAELKDYFNVRVSQWYRNQYPDTIFPYWDITRKWRVYTDMVSVSLAQCGTSFSFYYEPWDNRKHDAWGRGYTSATRKNEDVQAILRGDNFQEGFNAAIELDPDIIFLTGWNEWVIQKMNLSVTNPNLTSKDFPAYTDNFNTEMSRDIEMTKEATYVVGKDGQYIKEGYGDNYLIQMMLNIRRYKGESSAIKFDAPSRHTIDVKGNPSQWAGVAEKYLAISTAKTARDSKGFYADTYYTQAAPNNFVKDVQVAYDANNVYFKIQTDQNITAHQAGSTNWMNLLIGVDGSKSPAWENFNYVINRSPKSGNVTSLEAFKADGQYAFTAAKDVAYSVQGNVMQIEIPRSMLGVADGDFRITFKVTDSIEEPDNILDYYVSGESFPLGRMAYMYQTKDYATAPDVPGETDAPSTPGQDYTPWQDPTGSGNVSGSTATPGEAQSGDDAADDALDIPWGLVAVLGVLLFAIAIGAVVLVASIAAKPEKKEDAQQDEQQDTTE